VTDTDPTEITDFELVQRALGGDMAALRDLYLKYFGFCMSQALQRGCQREDAEDIGQEMFTRLAQGRGWRVNPAALPDDGRLHTYLAGAVKHMALTRLRDRGLGTGGDPESAGQVLEAAPVWPVHTENPEDRALRLERIERLRWALATLSQRQRQIARLRYIECLSGPDIAAELGIAATSVFTTLYQIREALRPRLACAYQLPDKAAYGFVKFGGHLGAAANRPRNGRDERYRARLRRQRTVANRLLRRTPDVSMRRVAS